MRLFAVVRARVPAWDDGKPLREQTQRDEHAAFMDALAEDGVIVLGGPLGKGDRRFLLALEAETREEAEAVLAADPWVRSGQLVLETIEPWEILLAAPAGL